MDQGAAAITGPPARDEGVQEPAGGVPSEGGADSAGTPEALLVRAKLMLLGESVKASGLAAVAGESTVKVILAAAVARTELWKVHDAQIKRLFEPELIAKQEILGYLLNDMMGKPLLHKEYAIQVGQRGDNAVTKAKTQLKVRSAEACYRSTKPAAAALLASTYDLKLPGVTVGGVDRRKRPPPEGREERELKARLVIAEATFVRRGGGSPQAAHAPGAQRVGQSGTQASALAAGRGGIGSGRGGKGRSPRHLGGERGRGK